MARIPEDEIERIKREVSLRRLVEASGVVLSRHGGNGDLVGRCVFHEDDETPSLVVTESKGLYHCFGCGKAGNVLQWVMETRGLAFREAAELLAGELGPSTTTACPVSVEMSDAELMARVVAFYHEALKASTEALEYLERRGLRSGELVDRFRLGYANRTLGPLLPEKTRVAGAELRTRLQRLGLWRESGHEHLDGSLVVPILAETGEVVQIYGRKINDNLRVGTPKHLYLAGPLRGVWNWEALQASHEMIVCESLIDAMTFWTAGYRNVTAVYGVEGLTEDHVEAFGRHQTERVLFAYDRDGAGDRGAERHAERLMSELGIECFRVEFPRGMDANEYALKVEPAREALGALIRGAVWMGKGSRPSLPVVDRESPPLLAAEAAGTSATDEPADEALLASPVPAAPAIEVAMEMVGEDAMFVFGDRHYRVRGLERNTSLGRMAVHVLAWRGDGLHADALDLAVAGKRAAFAREAAGELGAKDEVIKRDLTKMFFKLEGVLEARLREALEPKASVEVMSEAEREEAMELWRDPRLLERILEDFERCGVVGEETNKLVGYLAAVSRKLEDPLAVIIQSSSAAGKTSLMDAILAFVPEEERVKYSAVTGQSLFYMADTELRHKVLALVEEEGAERASYALKLLQSEGELAIASTGKDPQTGRLVTHEYRVEGPVALLLTTTAVEVDEELQNRCVVLTVDEDREQTRAIHRQQRERWTIEGLAARRERDRIVRLHRNAQRLLRPVDVINPWSRRLTFLDDKTRTRRDHEKYLVLIAVIAFVHQYQREVKTMLDHGEEVRYVDVELSDIELANRLAHEVLGRSLDELAPQTRRLLEMIEEMVRRGCEEQGVRREEYRFSRRAIREHCGWSDAYVRVHLDKLVDLEYVLVHRGGRGQSFVYELLYDGGGKDGRPHLTGLLDVEALKAEGTIETSHTFTGGSHSETGGIAQGSHRVRIAFAQGSHTGEIVESDNGDAQLQAEGEQSAKNAYREEGEAGRSYPQARRSRGGGA